MDTLRDFVRTAAVVRVPVILLGETGTGKSMAARAIHQCGPWADAPFLTVNCAGIPEGLFESELFGHRRGAFTGAHEDRAGLLEAADDGTLFLDEIAELPISQQSKLLTSLEDGEVRPVGGREARPVQARIISGTGRDLSDALSAGAFRRDLYHRLAVLRHRIPPLRERPEDTLYLAVRMVRKLARRYRRPDVGLSSEVRVFIQGYGWPGNVRQLAHALESAVILGTGGLLEVSDLRRATDPDPGSDSQRVTPSVPDPTVEPG